MKKSLFAFLAASLCLTACQKEIVDPNASDTSDYVLSAKIEQNEVTKTVLGEGNNVLWSESDQIVVFMKSSYGHKYQIKPSFAGKTYADFSKISSASGDDFSAGMEWDHNVAYYPYSESIECLKSGDDYTLEVVLPAEQTYERNSFGNGTLPMVAVSEDHDITFKNVCGGIKLQLKGIQMVKSITLQGNNNEKLSGYAIVTAYIDETKPAIAMAEDASTTVTLACGDGVQLNEYTDTEFIIALPPTLFTEGFVVTVLDSAGGVYELNSSRRNEVKRSSLLVMPSIDIREDPGSTGMLKLVSVDHNSYQVKITIPETVGPEGNVVRYACGCEAVVNKKLNCDGDYGLMLQSDDVSTTDLSEVLMIQENYDYREDRWIVEPIVPGEPTVFVAAEYTRDGQLVGEPEVLRFKTKEPSLLDADFDVEVSDISAVDATIDIYPDGDISLYCMCVVDDDTFNYIVNNEVSEADLQWFVSSYYAYYYYGVWSYEGATAFNLSSFFASVPSANTKYHILITGMSNSTGTSQCFKHFEFNTAKKRLSPPSILVTPLQEKCTSNTAVFNIKCTSVDDPNAGRCVAASYTCEYDFEWGHLLNSGYTLESLLRNSGWSFTSAELYEINSPDGYEISVPSVDGMTMRLGVIGYNEENTPNKLDYQDISECPAVADYITPFHAKTRVESELLSTDILDGEWLMTATDMNGNPLETTVSIIRGYQEGRDYPSGCPDEFIEQVEIFNQKRLTDKNRLLMQGWFMDPRVEYGPYTHATPYDLLVDQNYVAYNYPELFYDAGPKMFIEVDSSGNLTAISEELMPAAFWTGTSTYYQGYSSQNHNLQYIEFPIAISDDKKTMTIAPVGGSYLNLIEYSYYGPSAAVIVLSNIVLTKK